MKPNRKHVMMLTTLLPVAGLLIAAKPAAKRSDEQIARGQYLVTIGGCNDCHTPLKMTPQGPQPDMTRMLSGHPAEAKLPPPPKLENSPWFAATAGMTAWAGPWGVSYAANLTPHGNTGLGIWTQEMFVKAMRTGKHMSAGREILPPMPWQNIAKMTDEDLKALFAYLQSVPAIENRVPEPLGPGGTVVHAE